MPSSIATGTRAYLEARHAAFERFVSALSEFCHLSIEDAGLVANLYTKLRVARYNGMSYNVTHGAFLDEDVIERAVKKAKESKQ